VAAAADGTDEDGDDDAEAEDGTGVKCLSATTDELVLASVLGFGLWSATHKI